LGSFKRRIPAVPDLAYDYPGKEEPPTNPKRKRVKAPRLRFGLVGSFLAGVMLPPLTLLEIVGPDKAKLAKTSSEDP
jgi:hypothetical protein